MALSAIVQIKPPTLTAGGRRLAGFSGFSLTGGPPAQGPVHGPGGNRRHCTVFSFTGQSGTLDTKLRVVEKIIVLASDGVTVEAVGTATIGRVLTGTFTTTLAALTDVSGYLIAIGLPPGR